MHVAAESTAGSQLLLRSQFDPNKSSLLRPAASWAKIKRTRMATEISIERPLPHNIEAERSILGAILLDNHALNAAVERLRTDDFFLSQHRHRSSSA